MQIEELKNVEKNDYLKAVNLYKQAFPFHEQREQTSQNTINNNEKYHFGMIYDEGKFIGIILYWNFKKYIYVEHFAICKEYRGKGYGTKVLELMKQKDKIIILEIDPLIDDVAKKRALFYKNCGFHSNDFNHIHPPYHANITVGHNLIVMSYPEKLTNEDYQYFNNFLKYEVMNDCFK